MEEEAFDDRPKVRRRATPELHAPVDAEVLVPVGIHEAQELVHLPLGAHRNAEERVLHVGAPQLDLARPILLRGGEQLAEQSDEVAKEVVARVRELHRDATVKAASGMVDDPSTLLLDRVANESG